ncbi:unnamed protein product [Vicia faba]|uniref:Uncharacterized protein n=1 Tax=Vicia faba TaxID=3906 RepID=A0AAV1A3V0_VICFA|nr:unnamed protein product [Vicia faba]
MLTPGESLREEHATSPSWHRCQGKAFQEETTRYRCRRRGSLNAATGTHEFGLGSVKEIIEGTAESSSVLPGLPEYKSPHPIAFLVSTILISLFLTSEAARLHA